jgi:hypothetical protein
MMCPINACVPTTVHVYVDEKLSLKGAYLVNWWTHFEDKIVGMSRV